MSGHVCQGMLYQSLLGVWMAPWRLAHRGWCESGLWHSWLVWLIQERPEYLDDFFPDWCSAVGAHPQADLAEWLGAGAPVNKAWGDVACLCLLDQSALARVLAFCGAVSVFSRPDAQLLWAKLQTEGSVGQDDAHTERLRVAWRLSRLCRLSYEVTTDLGVLTPVFCEAQGMKVLLSGARAHWGKAWELVWPHWRWRAAPELLKMLEVDVRNIEIPSLSFDPLGFDRVWKQALVREGLL
jgi:hypothetical protein